MERVCALDAGLLPRSQYSEGPATGHLGTGFSWFPFVYKQVLRWFPRFQVATTCFSCSPSDTSFLDPYFIFMYVHNNHCHRVITHLQLNILLLFKTGWRFAADITPGFAWRYWRQPQGTCQNRSSHGPDNATALSNRSLSVGRLYLAVCHVYTSWLLLVPGQSSKFPFHSKSLPYKRGQHPAGLGVSVSLNLDTVQQHWYTETCCWL